MNRKKVIIIAIVVFALFGGLIIWGISRSSKEELLKEEPGLPQDEWSRVASTRTTDSGYKIITNKFDNYEIAVPESWQSAETVTFSGGLKIFYSPSGNISSPELDKGVLLNIITFKDQSEAEARFPTTARFEGVETLKGLRGYRTSYKLTQDSLDKKTGSIKEVPIEDSLVVGYIFRKEERIYLVFCQGLGDSYNELVSQCEKQVMETFTILDR